MLFLFFQNLSSTLQIENGHLSKQLVNDESNVYRGQIIAFSGNTGDGIRYNQLHFGLGQKEPSSGNNCIRYLDPFRTVIPGKFQAASQGYWTVDNLPIFPMNQ